MSPVLGESFRLSFAGSMIVLKIPFLGISVWGTSVKSLIYNIFTGDIGENCRQGYWRGSYNCKHMLPLAWYMTKFCMEHNFTGGISGFFFFFSSQTFTNPACCSPGQCLAHQLPSKEGSLWCAAGTGQQTLLTRMYPPLSAKLWFPSPYAAQNNQGNIIYSAQVSLRLRDIALVWWLSADGSYTKLLKSVGLCWCVSTGKLVCVADVRQWLDHTNLSTPAVGRKALFCVLHKVLILLYAASGCLLKSVFVLAIFVTYSVLSACLQLARRAWSLNSVLWQPSRRVVICSHTSLLLKHRKFGWSPDQ